MPTPPPSTKSLARRIRDIVRSWMRALLQRAWRRFCWQRRLRRALRRDELALDGHQLAAAHRAIQRALARRLGSDLARSFGSSA